MLPEQYRYLVWQLALLSSGRRWLSLPFDYSRCSQKEQISIPRPPPAQRLDFAHSNLLIFYFGLNVFLVCFFPHVLYFLEKQSFGSEPQLYNNILFLILFSKHLPRPLPREFGYFWNRIFHSLIRIDLRSTRNQWKTWNHSFVRAIHPRHIRVKKKYPGFAWTRPS